MNILNSKFNRLTAIEKLDNNHYKCECDCGNTKKIRKDHLINGTIKSCGCLRSENTRKRNLERAQTIIGRSFGMLKPIEKIGTTGHREAIYKCLCDCGKTVEIKGGNLTSGNSTSCGCNKNKMISEKNSTHGKSTARLYKIWEGMKRRCNSINSKDYKNYGGRGIKVCDDWEKSFSEFERWAFDNGYDENAKYGECTIDRVNVNGNYVPSNCRWVNLTVQARNRR